MGALGDWHHLYGYQRTLWGGGRKAPVLAAAVPTGEMGKAGSLQT